jgi:hypothetical protein
MTRPTDAANAEERCARIERMVAELAGVEQLARGLASDVRDKAERLAAEIQRVARAREIVRELESLEAKAERIAAEVADRTARISLELAELKKAAFRA